MYAPVHKVRMFERRSPIDKMSKRRRGRAPPVAPELALRDFELYSDESGEAVGWPFAPAARLAAHVSPPGATESAPPRGALTGAASWGGSCGRRLD